MRRINCEPRIDWQRIVESQGLHFHSINEQPYWNESAYYQFTSSEIDALEAATYELNRICLIAVQHVIDHPVRLMDFNISMDCRDWLAASWEADDITLIGRFDLAFDGTGPPKLLEYNADTPTSLLEAAVIQWSWLKQQHPALDQFNTIHEKLIEAWTRYKSGMKSSIMYFSSLDNIEDFMTVSYLQDTAVQAGISARYVQCEDIGWHPTRGVFTDLDENQIDQIFKLYPWEWLLRDQFATQVKTSSTRWLEAPWKMILSNKAILPVLWELFPDHPNLLEASLTPIEGPSVRKPIMGREGANVFLKTGDGKTFETTGKYEALFVYQRYQELPVFDGNHAVTGSWMVDGWACGIGLREDSSPITGNLSRFVPHVLLQDASL